MLEKWECKTFLFYSTSACTAQSVRILRVVNKNVYFSFTFKIKLFVLKYSRYEKNSSPWNLKLCRAHKTFIINTHSFVWATVLIENWKLKLVPWSDINTQWHKQCESNCLNSCLLCLHFELWCHCILWLLIPLLNFNTSTFIYWADSMMEIICLLIKIIFFNWLQLMLMFAISWIREQRSCLILFGWNVLMKSF